MGRLIYSAMQSLDGYVADANGRFEWAEPDATVHSFINDLQRTAPTMLMGRRLYEIMVWWETIGDADEPAYIKDFANIWRASEKVVYSTTLADVSSTRTRIERSFDAEAVRRIKAASSADISIGGPGLAAQAISAGLVDEYQLFVVPVLVGGGTRSLPDGVRLDLELVGERRFANGMVYLDYRSTT
jgi:dihydrofolate reductase